MNRAAFLDRDGVINLDTGYVHRSDEIVFVEGIFDVCRWLVGNGLRLIVVTNQAGVARGYYSEQDVQVLSEWLRLEFAQKGIPIERTYYCPHHPEAGQPPYNVLCDCRKPAPGMLLQAQRDFDIDLGRSLLIGDRESDIQAARNAGISTTVRLQDAAETEPTQASLVLRELGDLLKPQNRVNLERRLA